jgi:hypothetical protein
MLIYTTHISPRVEYIFDFILKETLGIDYELTAVKDFFIASDHRVKWSYGSYFEALPSLPAAGLLFEADIQHQDLEKLIHEDRISFFEVENYGGIDFDIFASAFYLISRYEEYLPCVNDTHGRYAAYQSVAVQFGFLQTAMVNRYIFWLMTWIKKNFPSLEAKIEKPKFLISIDVDHPFYSKDISLDKWILRSIKNFSLFTEKDKYDTYDFIFENLQDLNSIFFFLCPEHPSDMDHFNKRDSENFKNLVQYIKSKSQLGIHPSYHAESKKILAEEIQWLSTQHQRQIRASRHHYLRFDIESSPQALIKSGIQFDFSLAYSTHTGFRSGTSLPFYLYDLKKEKKTSLKIMSPCIMDSSFQHGALTDFRENCQQLIEEIKTYGGYFIPIFHNDILANEDWKENFKFCITQIKN